MAVNVNAPYEVFRELRQQGGTAESLLANVEKFIEATQGKTIVSKLAQEHRQTSVGIRGGGAPGTHREAQAMIRELIYQHRATAEVFSAASEIRQGIKTGNAKQQIDAGTVLAQATAQIASVDRQVESHQATAYVLGAHGNALKAAVADLKAATAGVEQATVQLQQATRSNNITQHRAATEAIAKAKDKQQAASDKIAATTNQIQKIQIKKVAGDIKEANKIPGKLAILFKSGGPFLYPTSTPAMYAQMVAAGSKGHEVWKLGLGPKSSPTYVKITIDPAEIQASEFVTSSWVVAYYLLARPA